MPSLRVSEAEAYWSAVKDKLTLFTAQSFLTVDPGSEYLPNWHIDAIAEYLEACTRGEITRLIINMPPRSLKSICVSVAWPAFLLGQDPSRRIMAASYASSLSVKHSIDCRLVMQSDWYKRLYPNTVLTDDQNQKQQFVTTARGLRRATSVGASTIGEGGNYLIVDDLVHPMQALSDIERENANTWFDQSFATRLNDKKKGVIVVVMQRLHENDLTGHLLAKGGWEHLCLPAIAEQKQTITYGPHKKVRNVGDILHESREAKAELDRAKRELGSFAFAGQYQQSPLPLGGGIIKREWFRLWPAKKALPRFDYIVQSYDTAFTEKTDNDATAFMALGVFEHGKKTCAMVLDCWQEYLAYPELRKKAQDEFKTLYGDGDGKRPDAVLIEEKGSGIILCQDLSRAGVPVKRYNPGKADKIQRAHSITALLENGLVYLPESERSPNKPAAWTDEMMKQLTGFPRGAKDDAVDAFVQAIALIRDQQWLTIDPIEEEDEPEEKINPYAQ